MDDRRKFCEADQLIEEEMFEQIEAILRSATRLQPHSHRKVPPKLWTGDIIPLFPCLSSDAKLVALYLLTSPETNLFGMYGVRSEDIATNTGLDENRVSDALDELEAARLVSYDDEMGQVWVRDFIRTQHLDLATNRELRAELSQQAQDALSSLVDYHDMLRKVEDMDLHS